MESSPSTAEALPTTDEPAAEDEVGEQEEKNDKDVEGGSGDNGNTPVPAPEREKWGSKMAYVLTLIGYAVGFGNIWRFPYQVRENGGLVFLIPYFAMLAILGIPLFFLELAVGQRQRKDLLRAWQEISPALAGIGLASGWLCFMVSLYYNTLLAYCISYMVDSFWDPLPWKDCSTVSKHQYHIDECKGPMSNRTTKYYWFRRTLDVSTGIDDPGNYNPWIFGYLLLSWLLIYLILAKGTESVGKVVYFTSTFPYIVLLAFFIGNFTHEPGKAWLGAYRLLKPDWTFLYQPVTWLKAGSQIFYSLGLAEGSLVVFASYIPARNNCYKDAVFVSIVNSFTSCFAALVVFPIIGLLGHTKYDECVTEMAALLPGSKLAKEFKDKNYDIYFILENVKTWADIDKHPIHVRYGYGELSSDILKKYNNGEDSDCDHYEKLTTSMLALNLRGSSKEISLRHCSIGQEATASGGGTGFVFMSFTEAVLHMKGSNFWSVMFFFMLITLGIDSGFGIVEGFIAAMKDLTGWKRWKVTLLCCGLLAFVALILFPLGSGIYIFDLLDQWTANWTLLVIGCLECIAVGWDYGLAKMSYDIKLMTGKKPNLYILLCWKYISPLIIIILLLASVGFYIDSAVRNHGLKYTGFNPNNTKHQIGDVTQDLPAGSLVIGLFLLFFCIVWIPLHCILRKTKYNFLKDNTIADFPEEELRQERHIEVELEEEQFSKVEKKIMGTTSLHNLQVHRDESVRRSRQDIKADSNSITSIK